MTRGRPPGTPKPPGSGRRKGTPNKATQAVAEACKKHGVDVVKELCKLIKDPATEDKVKAMCLGMLLDRQAPRLKAIEVKAEVTHAGGVIVVRGRGDTAESWAEKAKKGPKG